MLLLVLNLCLMMSPQCNNVQISCCRCCSPGSFLLRYWDPRVLLVGLSGNTGLRQQGISTKALLLVHFRKQLMKQLLSEIKD